MVHALYMEFFMTIEKAKMLAQIEANEINERVAIIYDKLNNDKDDFYTCCDEKIMKWCYPNHHGKYFNLIEFVNPR